MILIRYKGEQILTPSIDGYPGATVIKEDVPMPPNDYSKLGDDGEWIVDEPRKNRNKGLEKFAGMDRVQLVEHIVNEVKGKG